MCSAAEAAAGALNDVGIAGRALATAWRGHHLTNDCAVRVEMDATTKAIAAAQDAAEEVAEGLRSTLDSTNRGC